MGKKFEVTSGMFAFSQETLMKLLKIPVERI